MGGGAARRNPWRAAPADARTRCAPRRRQACLHRRCRRRPGAPAPLRERRAARVQSASSRARAFCVRGRTDALRRGQGFGWAIAKQLSQAGCEIILGTWVRNARTDVGVTPCSPDPRCRAAGAGAWHLREVYGDGQVRQEPRPVRRLSDDVQEGATATHASFTLLCQPKLIFYVLAGTFLRSTARRCTPWTPCSTRPRMCRRTSRCVRSASIARGTTCAEA